MRSWLRFLAFTAALALVGPAPPLAQSPPAAVEVASIRGRASVGDKVRSVTARVAPDARAC